MLVFAVVVLAWLYSARGIVGNLAGFVTGKQTGLVVQSTKMFRTPEVPTDVSGMVGVVSINPVATGVPAGVVVTGTRSPTRTLTPTPEMQEGMNLPAGQLQPVLQTVEVTRLVDNLTTVEKPIYIEVTRVVDNPIPVEQPIYIEVTRVVDNPIPVEMPIYIEVKREVVQEVYITVIVEVTPTPTMTPTPTPTSEENYAESFSTPTSPAEWPIYPETPTKAP